MDIRFRLHAMHPRPPPARSNHLRMLWGWAAQIATCKRYAIWTPAEQETVKLLFPNMRSRRKSLTLTNVDRNCAHAGFLVSVAKAAQVVGSTISKTEAHVVRRGDEERVFWGVFLAKRCRDTCWNH